MRRLTVLYDASCPVCVRCRAFMEREPSFVALEFVDCKSADAKRRFGRVPVLGTELVVVSDAGDVWWGPAAFLVCLWALVRWREWSYGLSGPLVGPFTRLFFRALSRNRRFVSRWIGHSSCGAGGCGRAPVGPFR